MKNKYDFEQSMNGLLVMIVLVLVSTFVGPDHPVAVATLQLLALINGAVIVQIATHYPWIQFLSLLTILSISFLQID